MKQTTLELGLPLTPKQIERQAHRKAAYQASEVLKLYPVWGCDDPKVVKEHANIARGILIRRIKEGILTFEQALKEVRAYRAKIKAMGWPVKRIMSPITFFKNDLRRRVSLGEVPEEPARRFARQMNIPDDLAEEFMNLD